MSFLSVNRDKRTNIAIFIQGENHIVMLLEKTGLKFLNIFQVDSKFTFMQFKMFQVDSSSDNAQHVDVDFQLISQLIYLLLLQYNLQV